MFRNPNSLIASLVLAGGLTVLKQLLDGQLSMRPIIGTFIVGTGLMIASMFNVPIAVGIAMLILLTSVLNNGVPILTKVMGMAS